MSATVCLACRTAFLDGKRCDGEAHVTVDLARERPRLIEAVWGDFRQQVEAVRRVYIARARAFQSTAAGLGAGIAVGVALGLGPLALAGTTVLGAAAFSSFVSRRVRKSPPAHPRGAAELPPLTRFARGRIRSAEGLQSPASRLECAAWALELRYDAVFGSRVMLRSGHTAGMEIALDNGERVRVPAGAIRLVQPLAQLADHDIAELEDWLREVDPARTIAGELCPAIPFNVIGEELLQVGDKVELFQGYEPSVISGSASGGGGSGLYREAPATILVPKGIATMRRVS